MKKKNPAAVKPRDYEKKGEKIIDKCLGLDSNQWRNAFLGIRSTVGPKPSWATAGMYSATNGRKEGEAV